jgi:hypothetical protein
MRDRLATFQRGERPTADQWNLHVALLRAQNAGAGCFVDSMGTYIAPGEHRQKQDQEIWVELTSDLNAASGSEPSRATGWRQKLSVDADVLEADPDYEDEITVTDTAGCFVGVPTELVRVRYAGKGSDGFDLYQVVSGGATTRVATLAESESLADTEEVDAVVTTPRGTAEITVTGKWIPSGKTLSGTIGVFYEFADKKWYPMVGSGC